MCTRFNVRTCSVHAVYAARRRRLNTTAAAVAATLSVAVAGLETEWENVT